MPEGGDFVDVAGSGTPPIRKFGLSGARSLSVSVHRKETNRFPQLASRWWATVKLEISVAFEKNWDLKARRTLEGGHIWGAKRMSPGLLPNLAGTRGSASGRH
jgi:hypothetical protein